MTIRHLRIFVEVAETGQISAAAKRCCLTQPTVSQASQELEEHYQVKLFERLSRRLYITEAGEQLLVFARRVLSQMDVLETNMRELSDSNLLRIGATVTVGAGLMAPVVSDLKKELPSLRTYVYVANTSLVEQKLLNSELDVGLVEGKITSPDLITIPMVDDFLVLAMAKQHPLAKKSRIRVGELADYDLVIREQGSGTRKLFEEYLERHGVSCRIAWEATSPDAIKSAVLYNNCLTAISVRLVEKELTAGQIHVVRSLESDWNRSFYLVYHKDKFFSEPMQAMKKIIQRYKCPDFLDCYETGYLTGA